MPKVPMFPVGGGWLEVSKNIRFTGKMEHVDSYPWNTYFVEKVYGKDTNNGSDKDHAFKSLPKAVSIAEEWDRIIVLPSYDCSAHLVEAVQGVDDDLVPIVISQTGLKILGGAPSPHTLGSPTIHTHVAGVPLFSINVGQVEIAGLNIQVQGADSQGILIGSTATTVRTHIHDCSFYGVADTLGNYGINAFTFDCSQTVIERCFFNMWDVTAIRLWGGQGSMIRDNVFQVSTAATGIVWSNAGVERPFGNILDNRFVTIDVTDAVGIDTTNTPTAGYLMIDGNRFVNFADDNHCITVRSGYTGLNHLGIVEIATT